MKTRLLLIHVLIVLVTGLSAQSNTMYYQPYIPQAYYLNPATQPRSNVFISLPVSIYLQTENSSLHLSDLIWNDPETGVVMHPFHPDANLEDFYSQFGDKNRLGINLDYAPISFGFRARQMYFTFDIISKTEASYSYPGDFISFSLWGNEDNTTYDFSGLGFHLSEYVEIALGISRKFGDMLTIGIRPKLLYGIGMISSDDNDISLYTSHEVWQFNSRIDLRMVTPGMTIPTDQQGVFDPSGEFIFDSTLSGYADYKDLLMSNKGYGIDIGAHFKPLPKLDLSASVIDIGFINWNKYTYTASLESSYNFEGIEYTQGDDNDTSSFIGNLWDSVKSNFDVSGSHDGFKTNLEPKIYIGGNYSLTRRIDAGLVARFDLAESGLKSRLFLHATWHPTRFYAFTLSYCPIGEQAKTFGTGVSGRMGPISYYTVFDYRSLKYNLYKYEGIPFMLLPKDRTFFNVRFGMNILIGYNQKKKLKRDKPMYYTGE
jgi:hypothetical protein